MNILPTRLPGVVVVETAPFVDQRGIFARFFCERELATVMGARHIVQINHSHTTRLGAVRGLHYQRAPHAEMKLVRCIKGRVYDVAVDLRAGSQSFLKWHAEELTPGNGRMLVIPEGCAHGFQATEAGSDLLYLHTAFHSPESEAGVRFDDRRVGIPWPMPAADLSKRDRLLPVLEESFRGISV